MRASTLTAIIIASLATAGFTAEKTRKPRLDLRAASWDKAWEGLEESWRCRWRVVEVRHDWKPGLLLDLRAAPRMAFSPVNVLLTAELMGGDDVDQFYCPEIEWNWDDGGKSVHESDCAPLEAGGTFERRFTAQHAFRQAGTYNVKVTMRKANRPVAVAIGPDGDLYIAEGSGNRIRKVSSDGTIHTVAGTGPSGFGGDGGPATLAAAFDHG